MTDPRDTRAFSALLHNVDFFLTPSGRLVCEITLHSANHHAVPEPDSPVAAHSKILRVARTAGSNVGSDALVKYTKRRHKGRTPAEYRYEYTVQVPHEREVLLRIMSSNDGHCTNETEAVENAKSLIVDISKGMNIKPEEMLSHLNQEPALTVPKEGSILLEKEQILRGFGQQSSVTDGKKGLHRQR